MSAQFPSSLLWAQRGNPACSRPGRPRNPLRPRSDPAGFTLIEVMISMSLALIVMAAMMSTFLYLGRNLNRLANQHRLESAGRLTLSQFARDARQAEAASSVADASDPTTKPTDSAVKFWNIATPGGGVTNVSYTYNSAGRTLTRSDSASGTSKVVLEHIQYFDLNYFNASGLPSPSTTAPYNQSTIPNVTSIQCIELRFTTRIGETPGLMTPEYAVVSPRLILRNRNPLE